MMRGGTMSERISNRLVARLAGGVVSAVADQIQGEVKIQGSQADVYADRGGALIPAVVSAASAEGAELCDVHISEPSLENLFLHHTGRSLRQ